MISWDLWFRMFGVVCVKKFMCKMTARLTKIFFVDSLDKWILVRKTNIHLLVDVVDTFQSIIEGALLFGLRRTTTNNTTTGTCHNFNEFNIANTFIMVTKHIEKFRGVCNTM